MAMTPDARRELSLTIRSCVCVCSTTGRGHESGYRLAVRTQDAGLDESGGQARATRAWVRDQVRALEEAATARRRGGEDFARGRKAGRLHPSQPARDPAAHGGRQRGRVAAAEANRVTGGWESAATDFRELAPALVQGDETEGYASCCGSSSTTRRRPAGALRARRRGGSRARPRRDAARRGRGARRPRARDLLDRRHDARLGLPVLERPRARGARRQDHGGGKIEPHEIASKTQMFTERYMVEWLLQNSLGPMWLAMCRKHGWTAEVEAGRDGICSTGSRPDARSGARSAKRARSRSRADADRGRARAALEVLRAAADPEDAVEQAPDALRDVKLLDPAFGSGHFLVVAFDLLFALYQEEARHRGRGRSRWSDAADRRSGSSRQPARHRHRPPRGPDRRGGAAG